jgi:hypothetical protein
MALSAWILKRASPSSLDGRGFLAMLSSFVDMHPNPNEQARRPGSFYSILAVVDQRNSFQAHYIHGMGIFTI